MNPALSSLPFTDLRPLGGGAFADVYAAESTSGPVVLKVARATPRPSAGVTGGMFFAEGVEFCTGSVETWSPDANAIIDAEAAILSRVQHPAFVRLLSDGTVSEGEAELRSELRYLVLERIDGISWRAALARAEGPKPGLAHVLEVARALADEARAGRLGSHGDLKPENLLLDGQGRARIIDPSSGMVARSPHGDVVRVFTTELYDPGLSASDLPALGLLVAEVLTGKQLVFEARETRPRKAFGPILEAELRGRGITGGTTLVHRFAHLCLPSEFDPEVPRAIEAVALRGLGLAWDGEKLERVEGFGDVGAFADALAALL